MLASSYIQFCSLGPLWSFAHQVHYGVLLARSNYRYSRHLHFGDEGYVTWGRGLSVRGRGLVGKLALSCHDDGQVTGYVSGLYTSRLVWLFRWAHVGRVPAGAGQLRLWCCNPTTAYCVIAFCWPIGTSKISQPSMKKNHRSNVNLLQQSLICT